VSRLRAAFRTMTTERVDPDAVMVALIVAPGVYSRNRMFALFEHAPMKAARKRASLVRGIVRQWMTYRREELRIHFAPGSSTRQGENPIQVTYSIESVRLRCEVSLSDLEAACLRYVASRGPKAVLEPNAADATRVQEMLQRLLPR
jgi:hypothetical protein